MVIRDLSRPCEEVSLHSEGVIPAKKDAAQCTHVAIANLLRCLSAFPTLGRADAEDHLHPGRDRRTSRW